jgi:predicted RNA polymerase sigma factor
VLQDSHRKTRLISAGTSILLDEQDRVGWNLAKIHEMPNFETTPPAI